MRNHRVSPLHGRISVRNVSLAVTTCLVIFLTAVPGSATTAAHVFPPDVYVFIDIPNVQSGMNASRDSAFDAIMREPEVMTFLSSGFPALTDLLGRAFTFSDEERGRLEALYKGEIALAVLDDPEGGVAALALVDVGPDPSPVEAYLPGLTRLAKGQWHEEQVPGATVHYCGEGTRAICYAFIEGRLVASTSPEVLKSTITALTTGLRDNLAQDATFAKCRSMSKNENPELCLYVSMSAVTEALTARAEGEIGMASLAAGLDSLAAVYYSSEAHSAGFVDEVLLYFPEGKRGVFAAYKGSEDASSYMSLIPADSMAASWTGVDLQVLSQGVADVYQSLPEELRAGLEEKLSSLDMEADFDLLKEMVDCLGSNIITYTPMPAPMMGLGLSGGFGRQVTLLELADADRFEKALAAEWERARLRQDAPGREQKTDKPRLIFSSEPFGDATMYRVQILITPAVQIVPSLAVRNGYVVITGDPLTVKTVLGGPMHFDENIAANSQYRKASAEVGVGNAGLSYLNNRAYFDTTYPLLSFGLPLLLAQVTGNVPVNPSLLPMPLTISKHLFASAGSLSVTPDSIRSTSYGPVGASRTVALGGLVGASLAKWYNESRRQDEPKPAEAATHDQTSDNELAVLRDALARYAGDHDGVYPAEPADLAAVLPAVEGSDEPMLLDKYVYVTGLSARDDRRLIVVFARNADPRGRGALLVGGQIMHLTDDEVAQQVGGWLSLPPDAAGEDIAAACIRNVKVLADSVKWYAEIHKGVTPDRLDRAASYRFAPLVTRCPAGSTMPPDYATVPGMNLKSVPSELVAQVVLVYETGARHGGMPAVAFLDGSVIRLTEEGVLKAVEQTKRIAAAQTREVE